MFQYKTSWYKKVGFALSMYFISGCIPSSTPHSVAELVHVKGVVEDVENSPELVRRIFDGKLSDDTHVKIALTEKRNPLLTTRYNSILDIISIPSKTDNRVPPLGYEVIDNHCDGLDAHEGDSLFTVRDFRKGITNVGRIFPAENARITTEYDTQEVANKLYSVLLDEAYAVMTQMNLSNDAIHKIKKHD